jgi:hypothetical protein
MYSRTIARKMAAGRSPRVSAMQAMLALAYIEC